MLHHGGSRVGSVLASFINLTQARATGEEGASIEKKMPLYDLTVDKPGGHVPN